ncbi:hypothetical protein [Candidatus Paracaedibacter symbiosus]|uniref:hypothetical protein n=1 Tax=Candidatus Paracaedibacter symbiosus TaxID=244582 RepID=UPI00050953F6|nr:hypothetical protein [Candidatus Paracaedibacter symbiosus]
MIEKKLTTTAGHFQRIFGKWSDKAPVGIFWTWGGWDDLTWYDYLTTQNYDELSIDNLYEKGCMYAVGDEPFQYYGGAATSKKFHVHFMKCAKKSRTDLAGESPVMEEVASLTM